MGFPSVDLVYELQGELHWDKDFASSACKEYSRWLQLRAKTGDFHLCKLPPSRVVAIVWNLHRQWTMDYEQTCSSLGGFIHHYPPAMRMSFSREQGYAVTLQTYKSHFNEDPPSSYWEPPICPSRPNVGPPGLLTQNTERSRDPEALFTGSVPQESGTAQDEDAPRKDVTTGGQKTGGFSRPRRRAASGSRQNQSILDGKGVDQAEEGIGDVPSDRAVFAVADPLSLDQDMMISNEVNSAQGADGARKESVRGDSVKNIEEKEAKFQRSHRGGRKVQEGYVLRPLAPGEKRRRGRPSLSEYIPTSEVAEEQENGRDTALMSEERDDAGKSVGDSSTPRSKSTRTTSAKGRKGGSSKPQARTIAPRPSREANGTRPASSQSLKQDPPSTEGTRNTGLRSDSKGEEHNSTAKTRKQRAIGSVRLGPDENPLRRPRGRPRKDGSWPVPRAKRQHMAQSASARQAQSGVLTANQAEEYADTKQEGCLSTTLVPTSIEHGDVPIPGLETDVGSQMLDTAEPASNGGQIQGAASNRGQEAVM